MNKKQVEVEEQSEIVVDRKELAYRARRRSVDVPRDKRCRFCGAVRVNPRQWDLSSEFAPRCLSCARAGIEDIVVAGTASVRLKKVMGSYLSAKTLRDARKKKKLPLKAVALRLQWSIAKVSKAERGAQITQVTEREAKALEELGAAVVQVPEYLVEGLQAVVNEIGLPERAMATSFGMSRDAFRAVLAGRRSLDVTEVQRIARVLTKKGTKVVLGS